MTRAKQKAPKPLKCIRSLTGITHHTDFSLPQDAPICTEKGVFVPSGFLQLQNALAYTLVVSLRRVRKPWPKDHECGLDVTVYVPAPFKPVKLATILKLVMKAGEGPLWVSDSQVVQAHVRAVMGKGLTFNAGRCAIEVAVCLYPTKVQVGEPKCLGRETSTFHGLAKARPRKT